MDSQIGMNSKFYGNAQKTRETCGTDHFEKRAGLRVLVIVLTGVGWSALPLTDANALKMSRLFDNLHQVE